MADLAVLRTAKQALDEGLLNPEDYDFIKKAFLRAQQIKAGLDAGFIKEEDFVQARDSFLHSLDFALVGGASAGGLGPQGSGGVPSPRVAPIPVAPPPVNIRAAPPPVNRVATQARDSPTAAQAAAPPPPPAPQVPRLSHVSSAGSLAGGGTGTVPIPTDLPARSARTSTTASGKVSGVSSLALMRSGTSNAASMEGWRSLPTHDCGAWRVAAPCAGILEPTHGNTATVQQVQPLPAWGFSRSP